MEELRKDVECTSQVIPHAAMVAAAAAGSAANAGRPNQMVAAVQAALAQQRSFAAAAMAHGAGEPRASLIISIWPLLLNSPLVNYSGFFYL